MKVLVVEDDQAIAEMISLAFEFRWPGTVLVATGKGGQAAELVEKERPDIVLLDLGLPDMDGMDVLREVRGFSDVPIIIITARAQDEAIVRGLERGADDYVTKPFDSMVLLARVKSVLGRAGMPELRGSPARITSEALVIDLSGRTVLLNGNKVALTATEWLLLSELARNEGKVITQQRLAERLWGNDNVESAGTIRSYVARLRAKLGDNPRKPRIILTDYGIGYRFVRPQR